MVLVVVVVGAVVGVAMLKAKNKKFFQSAREAYDSGGQEALLEFSKAEKLKLLMKGYGVAHN